MPIIFKLSKNKERSFRKKKIGANFLLKAYLNLNKQICLSLENFSTRYNYPEEQVSFSNSRDTLDLQVFSEEKEIPHVFVGKKIVFATLILFARVWNIQISSTECRPPMSAEYIYEEQATLVNVRKKRKKNTNAKCSSGYEDEVHLIYYRGNVVALTTSCSDGL